MRTTAESPKGRPEGAVDYQDYELQVVFEGLCEQVLDYLGIEEGRKFLYHNFLGFEDAVDIKIKAYQEGKRITRKTDLTDEGIRKICGDWK